MIIPSTKLTSSYFHHSSSLPFVYKTISQNFDETAAKYPDHECYVFKSEQKRYTYRSFKHEVDSLAASLLELGFEKNDRFAVWLPNTSENVAFSYVASKLGLIKVNINPAYVENELEYCINKVGCKGIILSPSVKKIQSLSIFCKLVPELDQHSFSQELSSEILPTLKHVILTGEQSFKSGIHLYSNLIAHGTKLCHNKLNERQASVDPDSPLAIFYTSGTTGQSKAATLTNFSILNTALAQWEHFGRFFTRLCVPTPVFHIYSEMAGVLNVAVAQCTIVFPAVLSDTVATMQAIEEEKCTAVIGAPVIFRNILTHPDKNKYDLSSLSYGQLGASPIDSEFLRQLEREIPITHVDQIYGMTESTGIITSSTWADDEDLKHRHGSLGKCMQRLETKVVDQTGHVVPIGRQGEIWTRGVSIMSGYYNDLEKTREIITSSGWLRTGDEARMDEDGYLYYIGRQKEMIIRGGVNIYPIEIENTIIKHSSVAEAQVFSIPDESYGEEVCAWIRLKSDVSQCQPEDIVNFLKDKLAFFKIPKHIRFVDQFIMTPTGKVQKFKLSQAMVDDLKETSNN
ncbi:unnamed protein product [Adineta steineri]|uniref:Medium-chain acyl-CoA ligase ACSF2, mitochondrial n=1 Tax=Adineta steineri TaxID=433720 RepID=A0A813WFW3_9BILA|nr:unnamed protein product [Adineta steineri]CAF0959443.1 unnamed protein product [Adineta steineri]CAF3667369.1 unnamed protein product [Adineta steineri]CAF3929220.1 unnamed protein product [Adineta steineri]